MVSGLKCDCGVYESCMIRSEKEFDSVKAFFECWVPENVFVIEKPKSPFYTWKNLGRKIELFATRWYRCKCCGCLWEMKEPDFPALGFVRKFPDGKYIPRGY